MVIEQKERASIKRSIVYRIRAVFFIVAIFGAAIVYKIFHLQFVEGEKWRKIAQEDRLRKRKVPATRGNIYAGDGESLLATSLPFYSIGFDPLSPKKEVFLDGIDSLSLLLSRQFKDKSASDYKQTMLEARRDGKRFLYLTTAKVDYQIKKEMQTWPLFRLGKIKGGIIFEKNERRYLPFKHLARRTIGFLNEGNGGAGLEFSYNRKLAGVNGVTLFRQIGGGYWRPILEERQPIEGLDIETTLDINIQDVAESALNKALITHRADYGCVAVMEVATGEILAIANLGKTETEGQYIEDLNYVIQDKTEPGSTFKLASYLALFEENKVLPSDSVFAEWGQRKFYERTMKDAKKGGYGNMSVEQAFAKSSNVAVSKLVNKHFGSQPSKFRAYLDNFGLTTDLGFQIKGYKTSYIKHVQDKSWSGTTLPWMSVGYEVGVTPLQTLTFYNAVANHGKMMKPLLVRKIMAADKILEAYKPEVMIEQIASENSLKLVNQLLEAVVVNGTATNIKHADYRIAGKTGTAQILKNGVYTNTYYASFCGFFPAENPKYSCIVIINNPKGFQQYGADVSAPVFKEVADKVYARDVEMHKALSETKSQKADIPKVYAGNQSDIVAICNKLAISNTVKAGTSDWTRGVVKPNGSVTLQNIATAHSKMPDVKGMLLRDALYILENQKLKVTVNGHGRVIAQSINAGTPVFKGSYVNINLN